MLLCSCCCCGCHCVWCVYNLWNCFLNNTFEQLNRSTNATKTSSWYLFINYNRECALLRTERTPRTLIFFSFHLISSFFSTVQHYLLLLVVLLWFYDQHLDLIHISDVQKYCWKICWKLRKTKMQNTIGQSQCEQYVKGEETKNRISYIVIINFHILPVERFPNQFFLLRCPKQTFNVSMSFQAMVLLAIVVKKGKWKKPIALHLDTK